MWVARDKNGSIWAYVDKPDKDMEYGGWTPKDSYYMPLNDTDYPEVSWDDEEPAELIVKRENGKEN